MKRKLLWRLIAAFFALLIVCTVIANAVYNAKLPVVTLTSAATMTLEESTTVAGDVYEEGGTLYVRYSLSAEDREIGGLGIFMVKNIMDRVSYEYADGRNLLTLEKSW